METVVKSWMISAKRIMCVVLLMTGTQSFGQITAPLLERVITIEFVNEPIDGALAKIAKEAKVVFSYDPSILNATSMLNLTFKSKSVREVLESIFNGSITYKERGKYIILTKAVKSQSKAVAPTAVSPLLISGYVINSATGDKLPEVSIYDKRSLTAAVSNQYGFFQLKLDNPVGDNFIAVNKRNFIDTILLIPAKTDAFLTIEMQPEKTLRVQEPLVTEQSTMLTLSDTIITWQDTTQVEGQSKVIQQSEVVRESKVNMMNIKDTLYRDFQASVIPFVGTNGKLSGNVINGYSFNLFGGYSQGTRHFEIGGLFNINRGDVGKVQFAGLFNMNGGHMKGFQLSGIFNANRRGNTGLQAAGLANVNSGNSSGVQVAGLANIQAGDYRGSQFAGVANVSTKKIRGTQLAGLLNYAKNMRGVQIGFINVADTLHGLPIGFFSYVKHGYHKLEISADEIFYTNIAFRTGTHKFYNIITGGIKPESDSEGDVIWSVGYGFGTAPKLFRWLYLNFDITASQVSKGNFTEAINLLNKVYAGLEIQPAKKFSLAFGITLNGHVTNSTYDSYFDLFNNYRPEIINTHQYNNGTNLSMWWGYKVALRFF
jgi:hypothetical protein